MKRGLTLRRFRSEVNVPGAEGHSSSGKSGTSAVALSIEPRGAGEADATELLHGEGPLLSHAVSQPNILCQPSPRPTAARRPTGVYLHAFPVHTLCTINFTCS